MDMKKIKGTYLNTNCHKHSRNYSLCISVHAKQKFFYKTVFQAEGQKKGKISL